MAYFDSQLEDIQFITEEMHGDENRSPVTLHPDREREKNSLPLFVVGAPLANSL